MTKSRSYNLLLLGLTAVFIGYLSVWLPGPGAGLSFLGFELGEWIKFAGVGPERNLFYLPPISLALILVALTLPWDNGRVQTWLMRGLGVVISLLAFPAWEDIIGPARPDYMVRVQWIGLVVVAAVIVSIFGWTVKRPVREWVCWASLAGLGLVGAIQPIRVYLQIQPNISQLLGIKVGFGWGIVLNGVGHLMITGISLWYLFQLWGQKKHSA
ncbi:MAG: hypothetical protein GY796_28000 [Chloroflexi bacterium]|nr:hypothetical protein [Chloroflexota bacterium]